MAEATPGIDNGEKDNLKGWQGVQWPGGEPSRHNLQWGNKEQQRRPKTTCGGEMRHTDVTRVRKVVSWPKFTEQNYFISFHLPSSVDVSKAPRTLFSTSWNSIPLSWVMEHNFDMHLTNDQWPCSFKFIISIILFTCVTGFTDRTNFQAQICKEVHAYQP